ncbi:acyl carrier protein [Polaromonas sp.]|uniref:acyl carrier protein n=1 Tax=Polaromonas sp. TaxID=1869339 RepID=UPI0013BB8936|nr:acyl carrier protein [Polaromonas sp.]NDP64542.1 acyl carrier protein [Polaromonas sp.]
MTGNTTFDRLSAILMKDYKLQAGQLTPDAPLEALGIDSLGVADLLFNIEDEFGISLPPEPVQLLTLGDVVRFIDELVARPQGQAGAPAAAPPAALPQATSPTVP